MHAVIVRNPFDGHAVGTKLTENLDEVLRHHSADVIRIIVPDPVAAPAPAPVPVPPPPAPVPAPPPVVVPASSHSDKE